MHRKTTKEELADSFLELAQTRPVNKITIAEITENCGLSSPTFYRYFKDKYDLLAWKENVDTQAILSRVGSGTMRDVLLNWLQYIEEHDAFLINAVLNTSGRESFLLHSCQYHVDLILDTIRKKRRDIPREMLVLVKVYCYGMELLAAEYLLKKLVMDREELADALEKCLPEALREYLDPGPAL